MAHPLRVGIIGASAKAGWARVSHLPAVQGLAGIELAAVATDSQATADAAASKFGVKTADANAADLIRDPNIDIVSVVVKAPEHLPLVLGALAAGKHVYCKGPLGRDVAESEEMATAAHKAASTWESVCNPHHACRTVCPRVDRSREDRAFAVSRKCLQSSRASATRMQTLRPGTWTRTVSCNKTRTRRTAWMG